MSIVVVIPSRGRPERRDFRESIERAIEAVKDSRYRPCQHIVRPAGPGRKWAEATFDDADAVVLRCASLCGWAMLARSVPA